MSKTANDYKDEGNRYFKSSNYQDAIRSYTNAIQMNPR
jgi:tetratricopeptide (TPR) repeat protein